MSAAAAVAPKVLRGAPMKSRPSGPGSAMANFLIEELPNTDLTNLEIAEELGYARPNIVSMWKAGKTKFTIDHIFALAKLVNVDPSYILALYIDQYVSEWSQVDRFADIIEMVGRMVSEEEVEIIETIREARKGNIMPMTPEQKAGVAKLFEVGPEHAPGPYKPLDTLKHLDPSSGDRNRFARRGHHRDLTISDIEEIEQAMKATDTPAERKVRKKAETEKKLDTRPSK